MPSNRNNQNDSSLEVKAPYRFVPLHDKIVSPHWHQAVSHDIPFEDGLSGSMEITLKAESDIFVGDGKKENEVLQFCNHDGNYFIPGTSLKGMIRNVLEILSFGGMKEKVENDRYAFRDLRNQKDYTDHFKPDKVFCGYLKKDGGSYKIIDCGIPGRISQKKIDDHLGTNMASFFDKNGGFTNKDDQKSAKFKYEKYSNVLDKAYRFSCNIDSAKKIICSFSKEGKAGRIVFTGQPSYNKLSSKEQRKGKHYEFVFFRKENAREFSFDGNDAVIKNFKFAYFDHDKTRWSDDWKVRRRQLENGEEIPVFFQMDDKKKSVIHLGLSYLYKLPYKHSIHEILSHTQKQDAVDLAETIFGNIRDKNRALKSRVFISSGWIKGNETVQALSPRMEVLASPKASYYPFYIKQKAGNHSSYMYDSAELAGWKRYPVHKSIKNNPPPTINGRTNEKVAVKFSPLPKGVEFRFKLRYHNLRKIELGAILSTLTFHNTSGLYHSIGMGKPLGYGKVKIEVSGIEQNSIKTFLQTFEDYMNVSLDHKNPKWHESEQVKQLLAMAAENDAMENEKPYMELKDFIEVKKTKGTLPLYNGVASSSISTTDSIQKMKAWVDSDKAKMDNTGYAAQVIHNFQQREKRKLKELFKKRKKYLLSQLDQAEQQQKEMERKAQKQKFIDEKEQERKAVQENGLKYFYNTTKKKPNSKIKDIKNFVEWYGRTIHECRNTKELYEKFPNGDFIQRSDDLDFLTGWLRATNKAANKREKREIEKRKGDIIKWIGSERAQSVFED
jgi:CRISPR-associated protein (TIGR03986 family)